MTHHYFVSTKTVPNPNYDRRVKHSGESIKEYPAGTKLVAVETDRTEIAGISIILLSFVGVNNRKIQFYARVDSNNDISDAKMDETLKAMEIAPYTPTDFERARQELHFGDSHYNYDSTIKELFANGVLTFDMVKIAQDAVDKREA